MSQKSRPFIFYDSFGKRVQHKTYVVMLTSKVNYNSNVITLGETGVGFWCRPLATAGKVSAAVTR